MNSFIEFTDYSGNTGYCSIYVHYGASAEHCGPESCNCGYRSYHCTGTAVNSTIEGSFKCSMATTKSGCQGNMGCSWTGYNYQCDQCAKTCYYE